MQIFQNKKFNKLNFNYLTILDLLGCKNIFFNL